MSLFRRGKRGTGPKSGSKATSGGGEKDGKKKAGSKAGVVAESASKAADSDGKRAIAGAIVATGVADGTPSSADAARRLPPQRGSEPSPHIPTEVLIVDELQPAKDVADESRDHAPARPARDVTPLFSHQPAAPELEVDPMATIGRQTTITGNIVSEEDLEIHGTIEGSVRLTNHLVTVGPEGQVKASVDAQCVTVYGRITGDVVAEDVVEVHKGGIVGGDIRAPRIIMHDGAIVVGGLDMSAALPNAGAREAAKDDAESAGKSNAKHAKHAKAGKGAKSGGPRLATVSPILEGEADGELPAIEVEAD